jgi:hypothetical protein
MIVNLFENAKELNKNMEEFNTNISIQSIT